MIKTILLVVILLTTIMLYVKVDQIVENVNYIREVVKSQIP
jgi:hypothetical protein